MKSQLLGKAGEAKAAEYLRRKKYRIEAAGYHCRYGEIDLIAIKGNLVVFVEVKLRKNDSFAEAREAVTRSKTDKIRKTALMWLAQNPGDWQARFDVIEIYTQTGKLVHLEGAFE